MITVREFLKNSAEKGRDKVDVDFDSIEQPRYDRAQRKLSFKGYAKGSGGKLYKVQVAFFKVEDDGATPEMLENGYIPLPIDILDHPIKVDCDCIDYTLGGALKGNLKHDCALFTDKTLSSYKKKTDRPENNAENIPYGCKHIVSFIYTIMDALSKNIK